MPATDDSEWGAEGADPWDLESADVGLEPSRSLGTATPARVGRFVVRAQLGAGTCATVYRAFDPDLEREVALKVPHSGAFPGARAKFFAEARALARLKHPGIVAVFEAGRSGDLPYLATDYIDGRTLREVLRNGPLDFSRAAELAADLSEALDYAHEAGVVHRDVKPANILVGTGGLVHLTDFGLACRADEAPPDRVGLIVGTPAYVAPEQATGLAGVALPASDQYSLGVVLYEMLCGRPPFLGTPAVVLYAASRDDPAPPRVFRPGVPRRLERICLKAMSRHPDDRYPDCRALSEDLRRWRGAQSRTASPLEKSVGWFRRRPSEALAAGLGLLGLAASTALATVLLASPRADSGTPLHSPHSVALGPSSPTGP